MHNQLTENDIKKMEEEIEYRKPGHRAICRRTLNIMRRRNLKIKMRAASVFWNA